MAGLTKRFKLNRFGGGTAGTISDDGQKYTSADRDLLDRLLAQTEVHDHRVRPSAALLVAAPTAVLQTTGGALPGGQTYRYRFAVIDAQGLESVASPAAVVPTPDLLSTPGQPSPYVNAADAGTLAPGAYYYALTALRGSEETPLGAAVVMSVIAGEHAVRLTLPAYGEADSFRVWRMGFAEAGFTKLGVTSAAEFIDDGSVPADPCACDPGNVPPRTNIGVGTYAVQVTLPADVDLTSAKGWRLYRSPYNTFGTASLVHEVVERADEWDPNSALLRSWTDTGAALATGAPADSDLNMRFQPFAFDSAATAPPTAGYPANYPLLIGGVLHALIGGTWTPIGSGSTGNSTASTVLTSPDGSRFALSVDNAGAITAVPTLQPGPPTAPQAV